GVHALLVGAIGLLIGSALYATAQYLMFLEQVFRMVGAEAVWVGPPRGLSFGSSLGTLDAGSLALLGLFADTVQAGCLAAAGVSFVRVQAVRVRALRGEPRPLEVSVSGFIPLAAVLVSAAALVAFAAVTRSQLGRAMRLVWQATEARA